MRPRPTTVIVCALGLIFGFAFPSISSACNTCIALGRDVHVLPSLPTLPGSGELLQSSPQDDSPPLANVPPSLSSRPGATAKLYLDFDGDITPSWGIYAPGVTPAYSIDSDTTTFTQQEIDNMREIWQRVAEAYSPFNIDVTTVDPNSIDDRVAMRVVVGGDGKNGGSTYWPGSRAGGIGFVGGFTGIQSNTVFVFPGNLANGAPKYSAMAAIHEAGHGFGLQHQSEFNGFVKVQEYSDNDPTTIGDGPGKYSAQPSAPFMGVSYFAERGIWFYGQTINALAWQNDVDVIASIDNAFGYVPDEAAGEAESGTPITRIGNALLAAGVITDIHDHDVFTFTTTEDSYATFNVAVAPFGAMLDASLALYTGDGILVDLMATASLSETLALLLAPGTYALDVFGAGNPGDIGQYTLTGLIGAVPEPGIGMLLLVTIPLLRRRCR